jgi:hypothetical protein
MKVFVKCVPNDDFSCFMLEWNMRQYAPQLAPLYGRIISIADQESAAGVNDLIRSAIQRGWPRGSRKALATFFRSVLKEVKNHG